MVLSDFAVGTILAFSCSLAFGTQTSFAKCKSVLACGVRMEISNVYFICGAALVSLIAYFIVYFAVDSAIEFSPLGILSALLLYFGELFALLSVQQIGVAYGMALATLSSSVTGVIIQRILGQTIQSLALTITGLCIVSTAVVLSAFLKNILAFFGLAEYHNRSENTTLLSAMETSEMTSAAKREKGRRESITHILAETTPFIVLSDDGGEQLTSVSSADDQHPEAMIEVTGTESSSSTTDRMTLGLFYSSLTGICYCSLPLPSLYVTEASAGIKFCLSFGVGCLVVLPLSVCTALLLNVWHTRSSGRVSSIIGTFFDGDKWHVKDACLPAVCAGIVWGAGNVVGICSFLYLDYVVILVYVQFHVIVALLYGICLWKEISHRIEIFFLSLLTVVLIGGCVMVTYGVYGAW